MAKYRFESDSSMKNYNCNNWWISADYVPAYTIEAENLSAALEAWRDKVNTDFHDVVSRSALRNKEPMYRDTVSGEPVQVGYVITGAGDFWDDKCHRWSKQFFDIWVTITEVNIPTFCPTNPV